MAAAGSWWPAGTPVPASRWGRGWSSPRLTWSGTGSGGAGRLQGPRRARGRRRLPGPACRGAGRRRAGLGRNDTGSVSIAREPPSVRHQRDFPNGRWRLPPAMLLQVRGVWCYPGIRRSPAQDCVHKTPGSRGFVHTIGPAGLARGARRPRFVCGSRAVMSRLSQIRGRVFIAAASPFCHVTRLLRCGNGCRGTVTV